MDKAKAAIRDFTHRSGHHDTTVHETVAPAVKHEVIKPHQHEEILTAVDKEVHQDHYHRTVQPVYDREVLPEQHTANLGSVEHREFDHRKHDDTKRALAADQEAFRDERIVEGTSHTREAAATVGGEHVHHHVHETIQPVVNKEVIQPQVVHTTVPIHEVHHNAAKHHTTSELPALSMTEFQKRGGVLGGREERYDGFEGEPKHIGGIAGDLTHKHDAAHTSSELKHASQHGDYEGGANHRSGAGVGVGAGLGAGAVGAGAAHRRRGSNSSSSSSDNDRTGTHRSRKAGGLTGGVAGAGTHNTTGTTGTTGTHKPSLMDKLNPKVDANGDGKAGFMK